MIAVDHAHTVLKGRMRNGQGEWVWCSIPHREWSPTILGFFSELGVFDSEREAGVHHAVSKDSAEPSPPIMAPREPERVGQGESTVVQGQVREGVTQSATGKGTGKGAVRRGSGARDQNGVREAMWAAPSTTWAASLMTMRVPSSSSSTTRICPHIEERGPSSQPLSQLGGSGGFPRACRLGSAPRVEVKEKTVEVVIWAMRQSGSVAWGSAEVYTIPTPGSYQVSLRFDIYWKEMRLTSEYRTQSGQSTFLSELSR